MSAGVTLSLDSTHRLADSDQFDDPTGYFSGKRVVYVGGHSDSWGDIESTGQWWFQFAPGGDLVNPVAKDIAFREIDDSNGAWTQGDTEIAKMDRPPRSAGDVNWNSAPASVTWGVNAHGGTAFNKYQYVLEVEYGPANNRQTLLIDPEIHHMKGV